MTPRAKVKGIDRNLVCVCGHKVVDHWHNTRTTANHIVAVHDCGKCKCTQFREPVPALIQRGDND